MSDLKRRLPLQDWLVRIASKPKFETTGLLAWRALLTPSGGGGSSGPAAFVFDIDGVITRGDEVLPAAQRALRMLYSPGLKSPRLPVAFLTNGGGVSERDKAAQLSKWLGVHVAADQVVLSHTPFRQLVSQYQQQPVLVSGRGNVLQIATEYGFARASTINQLAQAMPLAVPFWQGQQSPNPEMGQRPVWGGTAEDPFCAVMIFTDPSNWYVDLQLIIDVVVGGGVPGRRPNDIAPGTPPVDVIFSNPDLLWANEYKASRLGQGAFAACLEALHVQLTGRPLPSKRVFGKPHPEPYRLIERLLETQARALGLPLPAPTIDASGRTLPPFAAIYSIGDNPASDVRGANMAGPPWVSVLVKTGVFSGATPDTKKDSPQFVVDDAADAVEAALHRNRSQKWHRMR